MTWPFADPPDTAVFTTAAVLNGAAIVFVTHDADDGAWQFLDGGEVCLEDAKVVSLESVVTRDPSVAELADLPLGATASRGDVTEPWDCA